MSKETVTLLYPNNTTVAIEGDPVVIKQIVERLDGQVIEFVKEFKYYGHTPPDHQRGEIDHE